MPRDIIVIGGSAGAIGPLRTIVSALPNDLPAAVFVVIHTLPTGPAALPGILARSGKMPANLAGDGDAIKPGQIYVAPPNRHLVLKPGTMHLLFGPEENLHRPAIDPLFRSAAEAFGERVIAVLLSGMLDDGSAGMLDVRRCGGITLAQTAEDALFPDMPSSAESVGAVTTSMPASAIGAELIRLVTDVASPAIVGDCPDRPESAMLVATDSAKALDNIGVLAPISCPTCGGPLWEIDGENMLRYRCHVGHAFSADSLNEGQVSLYENALWAALRALEEKATLAERGLRFASQHQTLLIERYRQRATEFRGYASELRDLMDRWGTASTVS